MLLDIDTGMPGRFVQHDLSEVRIFKLKIPVNQYKQKMLSSKKVLGLSYTVQSSMHSQKNKGWNGKSISWYDTTNSAVVQENLMCLLTASFSNRM